VPARRLMAALVLSLGLAVQAAAQVQHADSVDARLGEPAVQKWRVGLIVTAGSGPCRGIVASTSVPTDWPEQQVRKVAEEISPRARVTYRMVDGAVMEMSARIPSLAAGQEARAIVTFEVERSQPPAPEKIGVYVLPSAKKLRLDRRMRPYLEPSPYIESDNPQIKAVADKIGVGEEKAWDRVETIYDWVREKIQFQDDRGQPVKTTLETLRDGTGDCDELSSLFIAICRAGGIPARTVRVPGHCYPEFYLEDDEGKGHWFPCQAAGTRAFGEMPDRRPILQKGDNLLLRDLSTKQPKRCRFLPDNLIVADQRGSAPRLELVCEPAPD
jgi:hypothetical protein